ncbi:LuxR C-terminal-related transcriptional regulator [Paracoccus sp. (in: a-proteobacteria)]|uniref:LuxR C-terminal-related transcriptional regulator n=1 Tax=Paracoccus sp. TaxID=267 RepID=UPI0039C9DF89
MPVIARNGRPPSSEITARHHAKHAISEVTLQMHRRNVMQKMAATSFADLVRIARRLEVPLNRLQRRRVDHRAVCPA